MSRIYLDACTIIYLVEAVSPFHATVTARLLPHRTDPQSCLITSRLSRLECRVQPLKNANTRLIAEYDAFFGRERLILSEAFWGRGRLTRAPK